MSVNQDIWPDIAIHPGENLADIIAERGLTQVNLATSMGVYPQLIEGIIRGEQDITHEVAIGLEEILGLPAQFWLNLQALFDNTQARIEARAKRPVASPEPEPVAR